MAERGEFEVLVRLTSWNGDHLQGSWTVLPNGTSSQDHCDFLSLQRSLWLNDDDTPGTMPAYEFFSRFLAWMYLGRLAEVAGRRGNRILTGSRKILLDLLDFWNRSKEDCGSEEKRFFETCWCIPTDTGTKIQFMKLAQGKAGNLQTRPCASFHLFHDGSASSHNLTLYMVPSEYVCNHNNVTVQCCIL